MSAHELTQLLVNAASSTGRCASLYLGSVGRTPSEEDRQLPRATEYSCVEIVTYSFQSWNIVEETETRA